MKRNKVAPRSPPRLSFVCEQLSIFHTMESLGMEESQTQIVDAIHLEFMMDSSINRAEGELSTVEKYKSLTNNNQIFTIGQNLSIHNHCLN